MSQNKYLQEVEYDDLDDDFDDDFDTDTDFEEDQEDDENDASELKKKEEPAQEDNNTLDYSIEQKDIFLRNIEDQINKKKQLMFSKREFLDKTKRENEYLEGVRADYEKYRNYIVHSKQEEMKTMFMLKSYIDDLIINGNFTSEDINHAKLEQSRIIKEINKLKRELDTIITV